MLDALTDVYKGKKVKIKVIVEEFTDNSGEIYLVTKDGDVYKHYDELSE